MKPESYRLLVDRFSFHQFTGYQKCNEVKSFTGCYTLDDFLQKRLQYILLNGGEKIQHLLV